jgi:Fe-S-cluster containining protein
MAVVSAPSNACSCEKCAGACGHKPGWFKPEEIAPLATALGLTEKQLFDQYLQVDWWEGDEATDGEDVFVLSPAVVDGDVGDMFDHDPRGECVWFIGGKCAVHDQGKPFECAAYHHADQKEKWSGAHQEAAVAWNSPEHQAKVKELLGRDPEKSGGWSIFNEMGFGGLFA